MGTEAVVTLGVSLAVPEPYGTLLQDRRASFGDTAAHGIPTHITLLPPTEVDARARPAIEAHLARVARGGRSFPVRLSGTGTFRPLSPVVFVRVAEGGSACSWLQERVRDAGGPLVRELQFPYHPHVTVAHGIAESAMDRAYAELAGFECAWTASGFALYEQGEDAVWRLRREFFFADADAGAEGTADAGADGRPAGLGSGTGTGTGNGTSVVPATVVIPGSAGASVASASGTTAVPEAPAAPAGAVAPPTPVTSGAPGVPAVPAAPGAPAPEASAVPSGSAPSPAPSSGPGPTVSPGTAACRPPAQRRSAARPPATL